MIPRAAINEIKNRADIVEIIGRSVTLKKKGKDWFGLCPFHEEKTPSFSVSREGRFYKCFGCGAGGTVFTFLMKRANTGFVDAVKQLAVETGVPLPDIKGGYTPLPTLPRTPPASTPPAAAPRMASSATGLWQTKAAEFTDRRHQALLNNEKALAALYRKRGLGKRAVRRFRLGLNPEKYFRHRKSWHLPEELNDKGRPKRLWIPPGLVIPDMDNTGRIRRLRIGQKSGKRPKYYIVPGSSTANMQISPEKRVQVVVENELDAMLVVTACNDNVGSVAIGGASSALDADAVETLGHAQVILIAADYDGAGKKAVERLKAQFYRAKVWPVPAGKDPGDYWQKSGMEAVRSWVLAGLPPGWSFGCAVLKTGKKGQGAPSACYPVVPEGVRELAALLKKSGIRLRPPSEIVVDDRWHGTGKEVRRRISNLVFFDDDVFRHLHGRKESYLHGRNLVQEVA